MVDVPEPEYFPFRDLVGFEVEHGEARGVATLDIDQRHLNPNRVLHGGVAYSMVDTAMGAATMSVLDEGLACATIEIHIRYLAPCAGGAIRAEASVRRAGRRIVHLDASVVDEAGTEIVAATGSFAVITLRPT